MHRVLLACAGLAWASAAFAAPNVANATQKGSLLIFPDIRVDAPWNTLVRLANDGDQSVDIRCSWTDGNKNRTDFVIPVTRNQPVWFDAASGHGTFRVNRFPITRAGGFDNPFLVGPDGVTEATDSAGPYLRGMLVCWVVDVGSERQVKWNHVSGTATVYHPVLGAYEYTAYAMYAPSGLDLQGIGLPGVLELNGIDYDACPLYQIGQFSPSGSPGQPGAPPIAENRLALATCTLYQTQDWTPVWTFLRFDLWTEDEVKFTGAYECASSWHETTFLDAVDGAAQNFLADNLGTYSVRYRVQGFRSAPCETAGRITQSVGLLAVQSTVVGPDAVTGRVVGTTLAAAGKFNGRVYWTPSDPVPEGGIR